MELDEKHSSPPEQPMSASRLSPRLAIVFIFCIPCASQGVPAEYMNLSAADSARLADATMERFLYRGGLECPYILIRHRASEVKGFLVLLHGAGDNPANFTKIAGRLGLRGAQYIVPRAPFLRSVRLPDPRTGREESFTGYGWLDEAGSPWVDRGTALSAFTVGTIIDQVRPGHADGPPLFLVGFRQGAGIAALWAAANPGRVQGLVLVAGYAEPQVRNALGGPGLTLQDVPCLVVSGVNAPDATGGAELVEALGSLGATLESHLLPRGTDLADADYELIRAFVERCTGFAPGARPR